MRLPDLFLRRQEGYQPLNTDSSEPQSTAAMGKRLGTFRAIYLVALCSMGSFLFAYDTGIVGGILTLQSFQRDFGYSKKQKTQVNSNCVSILQAGAFFGCFAIWPITGRLGRRWALVISSIVFCVGAILQVIHRYFSHLNSHQDVPALTTPDPAIQ
jgi:MFS family permease